MSSGDIRKEIEKFLDYTVLISKLLAKLVDDRQEVYEPAIDEMIVQLPKIIESSFRVRTILERPETDELIAADKELSELVEKMTSIMRAFKSDLTEARAILNKRGLI